MPREGSSPLHREGHGSIPIEVELLVKLDDQAMLERQVLPPRSKATRFILSPEFAVQRDNTPSGLRRQVIDPRGGWRYRRQSEAAPTNSASNARTRAPVRTMAGLSHRETQIRPDF
jgi:hypothetical protein